MRCVQYSKLSCLRGPNTLRALVASTSQPSVRISRCANASRVVCMAHPRRIAKVASQIQREVSNLLVTDKVLQAAISPERATTDSVTAVASITHVHVTNDLQHVKVYVSVYSDRLGKKTAFNNLKKLESYVRGHVGSRVRLRLTPEIVFMYDDALEEAEMVARVLEEERQRLYGPAPGAAGDEEDEDEDEDEDGFFDDVNDEKELIGYSSDDIFKKPGPFDSMFAGDGPAAGKQGKQQAGRQGAQGAQKRSR